MEIKRKHNLLITIGLIFRLMNGAPADDPKFALHDLSIVGETSLDQFTNFAPIFRWQYSHPAEDYLLKMWLTTAGLSGDSLLWESGILTTTNNSFKFSGLDVFERGSSYRFFVAAKHPELGWSDSLMLTFTFNTPPTVPQTSLPADTVFLEKTLRFRIIPASDRQINVADLLYNIRITFDSTARVVVLDTTIHASRAATIIPFTTEKSLPDNRRYFISGRAFDGVEYSDWSPSAGFSVNRINEPPRRFGLIAPENEQSVTQPPTLRWQKTNDPDDGLGTGLKEYLVEMSPDPQFKRLEISRVLPATTAEWSLQECRNHVLYYWRVIARDAAGAVKPSDNVFSFLTDFGNRPPSAPHNPKPIREQIVQPTDYLEWTLGEDPDADQDFSCEITIQDELDPLNTITIPLADTLLNRARTGGIDGFTWSYDGRVHFRLDLIPEPQFLRDDREYNWQVRVADKWGGAIESDWNDTVFRFDDGINQPPLPPVEGFSPNGTVINTYRPELKWSPATDPDISDRLRYEVVLSRDSQFSGRTFISEESSYDQPVVKIRTPLLENRQYFWRVRSIDLSETHSAWSKTNTFWVNNINEAPNLPIKIINPKNLEEVTPKTIFWWLPSSDPDPGDLLTYQIEFSETPVFINPTATHRIPQTLLSQQNRDEKDLPPDAIGVSLFSVPESRLLHDNSLYYIRLRAFDQAEMTGISASSPVRVAFNLKNDPPLAVTKGFIPTNSAIVKTLRPEIRWEPSRDPDFGDYQPNLSYQVEISTNSQFPEDETRVYETSAGQTLLTIPEDLTENERWFYRVRASDQHGSYSLWSPINAFITNAISEAPYPITAGFLPKDSMIVETTRPLISWLPSGDPDPTQSERDLYYLIRYYYEVNGKKEMSQVSSQTGQTSIHLPELKEDHYYYYQIAAVDPDGRRSEWSQQVSFGVNANDQAPNYFQLLSPYFGQDSVAMDAGFFWQVTKDKDPGSRLTYTLYYSTDSLFYSDSREIIFGQPEKDTVLVYYPPEKFSYATRYFWKVVATDNRGNQKWASGTDSQPFVFTTVGLRRTAGTELEKFKLHQNYPNPFNAETLIRYEVPVHGLVDISIFDLIGMKIKTLASGNHNQGIYSVYWNGTDQSGSPVANGVYICRLTARGFTTHIKVVFLR